MDTLLSKEELIEKMLMGVAVTLSNLTISDIQIDLTDLEQFYKEKYGKSLPNSLYPDLRFENCDFRNCTFTNLDLSYWEFRQCNFLTCKFSSCDMERCSISYSLLDRINIIDCTMERANIQFSKISFNRIEKTNLKDIRFYHVSEDLNLFSESNFEHSIFQYLVSTQSRYADCNMEFITIENSKFDDSKLVGTTKFDRTNQIENLDLTGNEYEDRTVKNHFISVNTIGSRSGNTYYDYENDRVICGCWRSYEDENQNYDGGSLEAFEKRVKSVYPEGVYHDEYMTAIDIFKAARKRYLDSKKGMTLNNE